MEKYGYVRVSTRDQNTNRQLDSLKKEGILRKNIYIDRISGKDFKRPNYNELLSIINPGDIIVVTSIDRLGRNYDEILKQWRIITQQKKAHIEVIDMPLLNTNYERDGLTNVFISDLVLQILAYVAETERSFIRQRQAEGIAAAKARGIRFGASKKDTPENFEKYYKKWKCKEISVREGSEALGISRSMFYRRCQDRAKK